MSMIILVTYDLKAPGRDYQKVYDLLKSSTAWWHYLESTWILSTSEDVSTWAQKLREVIDTNDSLFVVDITGMTRDGWLHKDAWEWITLRTSGK